MPIEGNKLLILKEPKIICFDLRKIADKSLKQEIESIIKHN